MAYAELHARSYFTFLDGASSPEELVQRALELGLGALALTDVNGLYGVVQARSAVLEAASLPRGADELQAPLRLLYGSELQLREAGWGAGGEPDDVAVVLALTPDGYRALCGLLTVGRRRAEKGECQLGLDNLCALGPAGRRGDLAVLAAGPRSRALRHLRAGREDLARAHLATLRDVFGEALHVELVRHRGAGDRARSLAAAALARSVGVPVVATNDVSFHAPERKPLQDVLRCIRLGVPLREAGRRLLPNAEACLKAEPELRALFRDLPDAVDRAGELAARSTLRLRDLRYVYPVRDVPDGESADHFLARLARAGLAERLGPEGATRHALALQHELDIIADLGFAGYFVTMWDIVRWCAARGILCQGRGSAANSLVCYSLRITSVRPDQIDMLFERFMSRERAEPPDIDLDIEHERREEVLQYVFEKYGREHAAMVAEVIRYRGRSAVRDVGKVLGFGEQQLGRLAHFTTHGFGDVDERALRASGLDPESSSVRRLLELAVSLDDFPRHLSIHVGGFVLSHPPLGEVVPIENGRMEARTVIQWDKDDVDAMGMFKVDLLGLGMLTMLRKAFELLRRTRGLRLDLGSIPPDDPRTYAMLRRADTVGVFQVESRAQMNMLPRLRPGTFYDLVVEVALVRPGPIQGGMVHPYLRRRSGEEPVTYPHPRLEQILGRTMGVPIFQEQVMRIAEAVADYTPGEADQLRRDMAAWRRAGRMERHREKLLAGMRAHGISDDFAEGIFKQIQGFAEYGFPESHAAAFAHLSYVSAYLRAHHPSEFACALINSQPMGFYDPAVLVNDARRHGVVVRPVDVTRSEWDCTLEPFAADDASPRGASSAAREGEPGRERGRDESPRFALRLGLRLVRGLAEEAAAAIVEARAQGPFESVEALGRRAGLDARAMRQLAAADALRSVVRAGEGRREALWRASALGKNRLGPLFERAEVRGEVVAEPAVRFAAPRPMEQIALDYRYAGATTRVHPMGLARQQLAERGVVRSCDLPALRPGRVVLAAGLVITRQRPAAKGVVFVTLEDETGFVDIAIAPEVFAQYQDVIRLSAALLVRGRLVASAPRGPAARNLSGRHFEALDLGRIGEVPRVKSHDFH